MPKGVDHVVLLTPYLAARKVQKSLMPKGVDHSSQCDKNTGGTWCKNL